MRAGHFLGLMIACALLHQVGLAAPTKAQRDDLRHNLSDVEQWLVRARQNRDETAEQLRAAELEAAEIQMRIRSLEEERLTLQQTAGRLANERTELHRTLRTHQSAIVGYLSSAHTLGGNDLVKLILKQQDPTQVARTLVYYGYLARARAVALSETRALLDALDAKDRAIAANHAALAERQRSLATAFERLAAARAERRAVLASISEDITARESNREELAEALVTLERALLRLSREGQFDARAFTAARGRIPWPLDGEIQHRFGSRRGSGQRWSGVFIAAPEGSEIRAVHPGQVVFSSWLRGLGLLLILDHGGGFMTLYAHSATIMKRVGEFVSSGEVIATTGDTGGLREPGLYFELRSQGKPADPTTWLAARN